MIAGMLAFSIEKCQGSVRVKRLIMLAENLFALLTNHKCVRQVGQIFSIEFIKDIALWVS